MPGHFVAISKVYCHHISPFCKPTSAIQMVSFPLQNKYTKIWLEKDIIARCLLLKVYEMICLLQCQFRQFFIFILLFREQIRELGKNKNKFLQDGKKSKSYKLCHQRKTTLETLNLSCKMFLLNCSNSTELLLLHNLFHDKQQKCEFPCLLILKSVKCL